MTTDTPTWSPQPGTIAARALAWFADQPPECEASTGVIAAALGQRIAIVHQALEPVFEHGLIAREKRNGLHYWSTAERPLRPLGAPPPVCADDDVVDLLPVRQRVVPATTATKETPMAAPTVAPPQPPKPKKAWTPAPAFDPLKVEIKKDRPVAPLVRGAGAVSPYRVLLDRLQPGDSVDLPKAAAKSLMAVAKKAGIKIACRQLDDATTGVWRLGDDA